MLYAFKIKNLSCFFSFFISYYRTILSNDNFEQRLCCFIQPETPRFGARLCVFFLMVSNNTSVLIQELAVFRWQIWNCQTNVSGSQNADETYDDVESFFLTVSG